MKSARDDTNRYCLHFFPQLQDQPRVDQKKKKATNTRPSRLLTSSSHSETTNGTGEGALRLRRVRHSRRCTEASLETLHHHRATFSTVRQCCQCLCRQWSRCSRARDTRTRQGDCCRTDGRTTGGGTGGGLGTFNRAVRVCRNKSTLWCGGQDDHRVLHGHVGRGFLQECRKTRGWWRGRTSNGHVSSQSL